MNEQHGLIKLARSKRFWTALASVISMLVVSLGGDDLGLTEEQIGNLVVAIGVMFGAPIVGYSMQDVVREHANGKQAANGESDKQKPA